jgi:peptide/nickel transport system substrate-binding protein
MAAAGCRPRPQGGTTTTTTPGDSTTTSTSVGGIGSATYAPDPGPFQTMELKNDDGTVTEAMVARGEVGKFGGTLTLSTFGGGPKTFNPWVASDVESHGLGFLLFERLLDNDAWTGKYTGRLVKSFEVSPDNLTYTFTMRKGVQWSDGKPLTADDVVFTLNEIIGGGYGNASSRDVLLVRGKFPKVEKIDDYTFRVTTAEPFAPLLNGLITCIAPKHIFEPRLKAKDARKAFHGFWDINSDPSTFVCSGPFKLKRYVAGQRVELERNPRYYMVDKKGQRLPYLDRFVVTVVPDQNTQLLKFQGRELDMLDVRSVRGNDVAQLRGRQSIDNFKLYNLGPDDGTVFMIVNMCRRVNPKNKKPYVQPMKQAWFNDVRFRQAISHAIDRQQIIDNVLKGVGIPLYTAESPAALFFDSSLKPFPKDLDYSAKLLQEAGFVKKPDGRLYDAKGNAVEFNLTTNAGNTTRDGICVAIVENLKQLGIKVNYQPVEFNMLIDKIDNSLDWEGVVMGLSGSRVEPYNGANVWKSNGRLHMFDQRLPDDHGNVYAPDARDWEKKIDELFDHGATTLDFDKRKAIFNEFQKIAYDQQPFIYIESPLDITAVRNTVGNYRPTKYGILYTPMGSMHNIEELFKTDAKAPAGAN